MIKGRHNGIFLSSIFQSSIFLFAYSLQVALNKTPDELFEMIPDPHFDAPSSPQSVARFSERSHLPCPAHC